MSGTDWGSLRNQDNTSSLGSLGVGWGVTPSSLGDFTPEASMPSSVGALGSLGSGDVRPMTAWEQMQNWGDNSGIFGKTLADGSKVQGWGSLGLGAANGIMNGWLGMQQYGLAKEALNQQKKAFDLNYNAQVKTTNARLNDQQAARYASNPNAYQSPSDYMKQYGIGG